MWLQFRQIWGVSFQGKPEILTLSKINVQKWKNVVRARTFCLSRWQMRLRMRNEASVRCNPLAVTTVPAADTRPLCATCRVLCPPPPHHSPNTVTSTWQMGKQRFRGRGIRPRSHSQEVTTQGGKPCPTHRTLILSRTLSMALCSGPCPPALALPYVPLQPSAWGQMVAKLTRGRMFADITPGRTTSASQFGSGQRRSEPSPRRLVLGPRLLQHH